MGNSAYTYATIGFGAIGAFLGGWPGMQIGMSFGSLFYNEKEEKTLTELESTTMQSNDLTVVPVVLGTDIANGVITFVGNQGLSLQSGYVVANVTSTDAQATLFHKMIKYEFLGGEDHDIPYVDMYIDFGWGGEYGEPSTQYINRIFVDGLDQWCLYKHIIDYFWYKLAYSDVNMPAITYLRYKGLQNLFYADKFSFYGSSAVWLLGGFFYAGALLNETITQSNRIVPTSMVMPNFSAEVSSRYTPYRTLRGDSGGFGLGNCLHGFNDGLADYTYGRYNHNGMYIPCKANIYTKTIYAYNWTSEYQTLDDLAEYYYYNVTAYGDVMSRSVGDRLYFFVSRNWSNAGTTHHPRVNYTLAYDMYYIDRSDDTLHSVVYNEKLNDVSDDAFDLSNRTSDVLTAFGQAPLFPKSMEIVEELNELWVFCYEYNDTFFYSDTRAIIDHPENTQTKIHLDLSAYHEGYWANVDPLAESPAEMDFHSPGYSHGWASINYGTEDHIQREIVVQTKTYIEVSPGFEYNVTKAAKQGLSIRLSKFKEWKDRDTREDSNISNPDDFTNLFVNRLTSLCSPFGDYWNSTSKPESFDKIYPSVIYQGNFLYFMCLCFDLDSGQEVYRFTIDSSKYSNVKVGEDFYNLYNAYGEAKLEQPINNAAAVLPIAIPVQHNLYDIYYTASSMSSFISTCKTKNQLFFSYGFMSPNAIAICNYSGYIDVKKFAETKQLFSDYDPNSLGYFFRPYKYIGLWSAGPSPGYSGYVPAGTVRVREYNSETEQYDWYWLILIHVLARTSSSGGVFVIRCAENDYIGTPLDENDVASYRAFHNAGLLSWDFFNTPIGGYHINVTDYDQKVFFTFRRGWVMVPTLPDDSAELWMYIPRNNSKNGGDLKLIDCVATDWTLFRFPANLASCKYLLSVGGGGNFSNYVDITPTQAITSIFSAMDINYSSGSFTDVEEVCSELIDDIVFYADQQMPIKEPRFLYSRTLDKTKKIYDLLEDIRATCQGIFAACNGYLKFIVPTSDEVPIFYFGYHKVTFVVSSDSSNGYIYSDFSDYPDNYWFGDTVLFEYNGVWYDSIISEQGEDYIKLYTPIPVFISSGASFDVFKDNIKSGSFSYWKKSSFNRINRLKVKYSNRYYNYANAVVHSDDSIGFHRDGYVNEKTLELYGIKRPTQASRMALRYLDYDLYVNWSCSLQTDLVGMYVCVGDIVGVTHELTNWVGKYFRVSSVEELDNDEIRLEMEEYNPYVYHDEGVDVTPGMGYAGSGGATSVNSDVVKVFSGVSVYESKEYPMLVFGAVAPSNSYANTSSFDSVVDIYVWDATTSTWMLIKSSATLSVSFKLLYALNDSDTVIYYDPDTVSWGEIPNSGYVIIGGEKIYYNGHDAENHTLNNIYRDPSYIEFHDVGSVAFILDYFNTPFYSFPSSWTGTTQQFKLVPQSTSAIRNASALYFALDIVGYADIPFSPDLLEMEEI